VEINPVDADKFRISEGQMVKVTSRRGTLQAKGQNNRKKPSGNNIYELPLLRKRQLTSLPILLWIPIGKIPEYKVCAVKLEAA